MSDDLLNFSEIVAWLDIQRQNYFDSWYQHSKSLKFQYLDKPGFSDHLFACSKTILYLFPEVHTEQNFIL